MNTLARMLASFALAAGVSGCGGSDPLGASSENPAFVTERSTLDEALVCTPFEHPDKPPVLLVHGTFATGTLQYTQFYLPQLAALGYDVCAVTYPDRGLGDMQIAAEYVANALMRMNERTGRKVAMIGHSQGASMPRWALRYFPSARAAVDDFVLLAGPNHGTSVSFVGDVLDGLLAGLGLGELPVGLLPASIYQFARNSDFNAAVNSGDETPGDIDYTSIYTVIDELVQPTLPVPTQALEFGLDNPRVTNVLLQDVCPLALVEHVSIGTTDPIAFALALDAITHPGPANVERAGGAGLCTLLPVDLSTLLIAPPVQGVLDVLQDTLQAGVPTLHLEAGEPPLMPYAAADAAP